MAERGTGRLAVSLFSGAGGPDLGVERAGYSVVYAVENDPIAVATLNSNRERLYPELGEVSPLDITKLEGAASWCPASGLPSENDLAAEYGVARMTVRRAARADRARPGPRGHRQGNIRRLGAARDNPS
jgi:C-5 cytosine-specific DNA methylase/Bacterial regulatory proteins, gntR family